MSGNGLGIADYFRVIEAGASSILDVRGNFVRIQDAQPSVLVNARQLATGQADAGARQIRMRKFEKQQYATEFDSVEIVNDSDATQNVQLQIGYGDYTAEVTSRSQAARFINYRRLFTEADLDLANECIIAPENLLRKRIMIQVAPTGVTVDSAASAFLNVSCVVPPDSEVNAIRFLWSHAHKFGKVIDHYELWGEVGSGGGDLTWATMVAAGSILATVGPTDPLTFDFPTSIFDTGRFGIRVVFTDASTPLDGLISFHTCGF